MLHVHKQIFIEIRYENSYINPFSLVKEITHILCSIYDNGTYKLKFNNSVW